MAKSKHRSKVPVMPVASIHCMGHKVPVLAFPGVAPLYGASGTDRPLPPAGAILVDLAGHLSSPVRTIGFEIPGLEFRRVYMDWPDMATPPISPLDWERLARGLKKLRAPCLVACMKGHGRTGTALAILAHFMGYLPAHADPVAAVRKAYCHDAIETVGQVEYVTAMTGRKTSAQPSYAVAAKPAYEASDSKYSPSGLCPDKIGNAFCNLNIGHGGKHDTRQRSDIQKDLSVPWADRGNASPNFATPASTLKPYPSPSSFTPMSPAFFPSGAKLVGLAGD